MKFFKTDIKLALYFFVMYNFFNVVDCMKGLKTLIGAYVSQSATLGVENEVILFDVRFNFFRSKFA